MSISLDVPIKADAEIRIYDVCVGAEDLAFEVRVDRDGDIRIEISEDDFIRVARERFGLVEVANE